MDDINSSFHSSTISPSNDTVLSDDKCIQLIDVNNNTTNTSGGLAGDGVTCDITNVTDMINFKLSNYKCINFKNCIKKQTKTCLKVFSTTITDIDASTNSLCSNSCPVKILEADHEKTNCTLQFKHFVFVLIYFLPSSKEKLA